MHLYKLPEPNQYLFSNKRSLYNLYAPKDLDNLLPVPESIYRSQEKHFGKLDAEQIRNSAVEHLKRHFLAVFSANHFNSVQKKLVGFFIYQYKISKDQYTEALQKVLTENHSFDVQVQLAKYQSIKKENPLNFFQRIFNR